MSTEDPRVRRDRRTIVVIDDDPHTSGMLTSWFSGRSYDVLSASDGPTGLELARVSRPDLILLDLRMPGQDGLTVAQTLKGDPVTRAFAAGADDYVTKPFDVEEIDARIHAMLRRSDFLSSLESTIQDLKVTNSELERLLTLDEKTGLHNFREFRRKLREEWFRAERYGTPLSLVMLDIDDFKKFNDSFGHQAGDRALQEFATLVAGGARVTDTAARYGGEEFAVILPHTDSDMAARVAERIRAAVEDFLFAVGEESTRITVSAGVATYPTSAGGDTVDALVRVADEALFRAKSEGKNRVVLADALPEEQRLEIERRRGNLGSTRRIGPLGRADDHPTAR
jgi:diguanylate cyclase (GGDEF)-like protein